MTDNPWWRLTNDQTDYEWLMFPICRMTVREPEPEEEGDGDVIRRLFRQSRYVERPKER